MSNPLEELLQSSPEGKREQIRAQLRVAVSEGLLCRMEEQGISKQELAKRIGVSRSAVSQALASTRNLSLNLLADLAHALGLKPSITFSSVQESAFTAVLGSVRPHYDQLARFSGEAQQAQETLTVVKMKPLTNMASIAIQRARDSSASMMRVTI